jgi:hypothetical protein
MKKIYFIVLLICSINATGQKYKFTLGWQPRQESGESYTLTVGNYQSDRYYQKNNDVYNGLSEFIDYELQLNPTDHLLFELDDAVNDFCGGINHQVMEFPIHDILFGYFTASDGCWGTGEIINFRPTEIVLNSTMIPEYSSGNPPHYTICSGAQLEIFATIPNKNPIVKAENYYPPLVFHWQYSIDNKKSWIDVPEYIVKNGVSTKNTSYNTPKLTASIDEIIGLNHKDYYNKTIYFQLGCNINVTYVTNPNSIYYNQQNTSYASLDYGVLYLKCTPIVDGDIIVKAPNCSYQDIKEIKIPFDRDLEENEELRYMSLYNDITPGTPLKTIESSVIYKNKTFLFPVEGLTLQPNVNYQINYVAFKNDKPRASESSKYFQYKQPTPVTFEIKKADNPKCNNDQVEVVIDAHGGTGEYQFYVDDIEQKAPKLSKEIDNYYHIKGLSPSAINNIKVTDTNGCIEE